MAKAQCDYHASSAATWECDDCCKDFCRKCIVVRDVPRRAPVPRCPLCENQLTFLGTGQSARPFWAVAHVFFAYPFRGSCLGLLVLSALMGLVIGAGIFSLPLFILLGAVILRYGVAVLGHIATGHQDTPSLGDAVEGDGEGVFFKFIGLVLVCFGIVLMVDVLVSPVLGMVLSILMSLLFPAMIIFLAAEKSLNSVFNPTRLIWLIGIIGWPYALVVFLCNVLAGGPALVVTMLGEELTGPMIVALMTASLAYFGVVQFCMLGYVMFERQGELGYVAGSVEDVVVADSPTNRFDELFGLATVLTKEGRAADALKRVNDARTEFKGDPRFYERAMQLALSARDERVIETLTNDYLDLLVSKDAVGQGLDWCRKAMAVRKGFRPRSPSVSHALAEEAYARNLNRDALALLANLHKRSPDYGRLGDAYRLAAMIFRDGLGDDARASELEAFVTAKGYS